MNNFKPECQLSGEDGNIFNLAGKAGRVLKEHNMKDEAKEMQNRIFDCSSYDEALDVIGDYVEVS